MSRRPSATGRTACGSPTPSARPPARPSASTSPRAGSTPTSTPSGTSGYGRRRRAARSRRSSPTSRAARRCTRRRPAPRPGRRPTTPPWVAPSRYTRPRRLGIPVPVKIAFGIVVAVLVITHWWLVLIALGVAWMLSHRGDRRARRSQRGTPATAAAARAVAGRPPDPHHLIRTSPTGWPLPRGYAGHPVVPAGTSRLTTAPAPTTATSPTTTPVRIWAALPIRAPRVQALGFLGAGETTAGPRSRAHGSRIEAMTEPSTTRPPAFRAARDQLLALRGEHERAVAEFALPRRGRAVELGRRLVRRLRPRQRPARRWSSSRRTGQSIEPDLRRAGRTAPTRSRSGSATAGYARATPSSSCSATRSSSGRRCSRS